MNRLFMNKTKVKDLKQIQERILGSKSESA